MVTHTPVTDFMGMPVLRFLEFYEVIGDVVQAQRNK